MFSLYNEGGGSGVNFYTKKGSAVLFKNVVRKIATA